MSSLSEAVPHDSGPVVRVCLVGELDVATGPREFLRIMEAGPQAGGTMELDLGGVSFIDSSGVAMLMKIQSYLDGVGCHLVLTNLSRSASRLLVMLGLTKAFSLESGPSTPE